MKINKFLTNNSLIEKRRTIFLVGVVCFLVFFLTTFASAITWDNVVYYNFDETSGTTLIDSVGYNTVTIDQEGVLGRAYYFNGTNSLVNLSNKEVKPKNLTLSLWFKRGGVIGGSNVIIKNTPGPIVSGWTLEGGTAATIWNATAVLSTAGVVPIENVWIHFVVVANGTHIKIFKNGTEVGVATSLIGDISYGADDSLIIGADGGGANHINGTIDELGIWNRSLSDAEILELWNDGAGLTYEEGIDLVSASLSSPVDDYGASNDSVIVYYNLTSSGDYNLTNSTLYVYYNNGTLFTSITNASSGQSQNVTNIVANLSVATYIWNVQAFAENSTGTAINTTSSNRTFTYTPFTEGGSDYEIYAYETASEIFIQNLTTSSLYTVTSANLVYNGTNYGEVAVTNYGSGLFKLSKALTIPLGPAGFSTYNRTFYWSITLTKISTGTQSMQNSSTYTQNVSELLFNLCSATLTSEFVNFTGLSETNLSAIGFIMDANFDYWLGDGSVYKNISIDSSANSYNYTMCSNNGNLTVNSIVNAQSAGYSERTLFFNGRTYNNVTLTTETIILLATGLGTSVIVQVTDPGLAPLENIFVNVYRYYPGTNTYTIIENAKTDEFGQFVAKLIEPNTIKYQFEFINSAGTVLKRTGDIAIACRATICVIPFVIEDTTDDFDIFTNITDFEYTLSFSNATNIFIYTWSDVTGDSITSRLLVELKQFNGTTVICDTTSTSLSSSLTCDVSAYGDGTYITQAFRTVSGEEERRINILYIEIGGTVGIFGREGLFWSFFLIFTMVAVGSFNPTVGILLYLVGFIGLGSLGIISMTAPVSIAMILIGVLFIWAIRS